MVKIKTTIGSHEIEVEVDESQWEQGCCGCKTPEIDPKLENCEIPEPETERVVVPKMPPMPVIPPEDALEVPISVIASLLPCEKPGLGPCPRLQYHPAEEMEGIPEGATPITIDFGPKGGEALYSGELYLAMEYENKCCCQAEGDIDVVHFYPKFKWIRKKCGHTDWKRFYGPLEMLEEELDDCTIKKTLLMHSAESRIKCGKWEVRNPIALPVGSILEPKPGTPEYQDVLYRVFIDHCKIWRQNVTLEIVCGRLTNFALQPPECLGPDISEDIEYVTAPRIICQASNSPDTECACVGALTFVRRVLHIEGLCIGIKEETVQSIKLPYIEYFEAPIITKYGTGWRITFPRKVVDWCQYADLVVNADGEQVNPAEYCHCNLPPHIIDIPGEEEDLCGEYLGSPEYFYTISVLVDTSIEKDENGCLWIVNHRNYLNFCDGRLVSVDAAPSIRSNYPLAECGDCACSCDCCSCSCEESSTAEPSASAEPLSSIEEPSTSYEEPSSSTEEPSASYNEPSSSYEEPSTSYEEPSTSYEEPSTSYEEPSTSYEEPSASYEEPSTSYEEPSTSYEEPSTSYEEPSTSYEEPSDDEYYTIYEVPSWEFEFDPEYDSGQDDFGSYDGSFSDYDSYGYW